MVQEISSPVGLIAGSGSLPVAFARAAVERGLEVIAIAHIGETEPELATFVKNCTWLKVGQLGKIIKTLRRAGVKHVALAGGISRVRLFKGVRLDWCGARLVARVGSIRDDLILRGIAQELERNSLSVISAGLLLEKYIPKAGLLSKRPLSASERKDAQFGWLVAERIGELDIGQAVVVTQGVVSAVEAVEGTDRAILRAGELAGPGAVVVKVCKPQQDLRLDLPTVGVNTIGSMRQAGATALLLQSGKTLIIDPLAVIEVANSAHIAIQVCDSLSDLS